MPADFEFALDQLADESRPIRSVNLANLSDLSRDQADRFRVTWANLSPERRLEAISGMVEQAESNIHLNFHAILRGCLTDPNAAVRKLAVEGLWEDERTSLVHPLLAILASDADTDVRAVAASSLGRFVLLGVLGDIARPLADEVESGLRTAWLRPKEVVEVRRRALEGLAYSESPEVQTLIENAYFDEDELMRQSAVFAMGRTADRRWTRYVMAELHSAGAPMRFEAAAAAGELRLPGAVKTLTRLMDDPDGAVRESAALALGKIGGKEAQRALRAAVEGDDARLAEAAQDALDELAFNSEELEDAALLSYEPEPGADGETDDEADEDDDWSETTEGEDEFDAEGDEDDEWDMEDEEDLSWVDDEEEEEGEDEDWDDEKL
jgi:HEAT repeat protein